MKKSPLALAAAIFCFALAPRAAAQSEPLQRNDSERRLFELLNEERASHGLAELRWDAALFKAARQHALLMLNLNSMEHQLPGEPGLEERLAAAGARFTQISENIAIGPSPSVIHDGWMDSPGHRKNILDPHVTAVGIAAVRGNGGLFAVEDFSRAFVALSSEQQEKQVGALLTARGFRVSGAAEDARKACDGAPAMGNLHSVAVLRFEITDLTELPPELEKKIHNEAMRNAAVGACPVGAAPGFARYRIAVLFF